MFYLMAKDDYLSVLKMMKLVKYQLFTESAAKLDSESTCFFKKILSCLFCMKTLVHK